MIWASIPLMTVIDIMVIGVTLFALWSFYRLTPVVITPQTAVGRLLILVGLLLIGGFYGVDLYSMHVMPFLASKSKSMTFMHQLHLNYSWIVIAISVGFITVGFTQVNRELAKERQSLEVTVQQRTMELQQNKQYLEHLISSSMDPIITTDREGKIGSFNLGAEKVLGYEQGEILGKRVTLLYEDEERAKEVMRRMRESGGAVAGFETLLRAKDGSLIPALISASILYDEDGHEAGTVEYQSK